MVSVREKIGEELNAKRTSVKPIRICFRKRKKYYTLPEWQCRQLMLVLLASCHGSERFQSGLPSALCQQSLVM